MKEPRVHHGSCAVAFNEPCDCPMVSEQLEDLRKELADSKNKWIKVGEIGVDAGMCWIGDPCYIMHQVHSAGSHIESLRMPEPKPKEVGNDWIEFCRILHEKEENAKQPAAQFNYDMGHPGLGVCVQSGYGDGSYDVFIRKNDEGRVMEAKIVFIEEGEEDSD